MARKNRIKQQQWKQNRKKKQWSTWAAAAAATPRQVNVCQTRSVTCEYHKFNKINKSLGVNKILYAYAVGYALFNVQCSIYLFDWLSVCVVASISCIYI